MANCNFPEHHQYRLCYFPKTCKGNGTSLSEIIYIGEKCTKAFKDNPEKTYSELIKRLWLMKDLSARIKAVRDKNNGLLNEDDIVSLSIILFLANRVYQCLKEGFEEKVYQDALEIEFRYNNIPYFIEKPLMIKYEYRDPRTEKTVEIDLQHTFRADFYVFDKYVVELKSKWLKRESDSGVLPEDKQTINYLSATKQKCGIMLNFYGRAEEEDPVLYHTIYKKSQGMKHIET